MNSSIFDLEKKLISLKSSNLLIAIKAEFEAEGTRIDELSVISYLCTKNKIPLTLKIGGPCAKRDIYEAFQLGANNILVPMVECEFALDFCYRSYISLIPAFLAAYNTAEFKLPPIFGVAKISFLTFANFAGIAFIRSVDGRFPGKYIPTEEMGTYLYSNFLFTISSSL